MSRAALLGALMLAGCASAPPPPGTQVDDARFAQATVPGQASRASVLAALGPTRSVQFDSGYQVWLYQSPRGAGRYAELVILFSPDGMVSKTRRREPLATDPR